jgi:hypothetical protein
VSDRKTGARPELDVIDMIVEATKRKPTRPRARSRVTIHFFVDCLMDFVIVAANSANQNAMDRHAKPASPRSQAGATPGACLHTRSEHPQDKTETQR